MSVGKCRLLAVLTADE